MESEAPCCSHMRVLWTTEIDRAGLTHGWWKCSDCEAEFVPFARAVRAEEAEAALRDALNPIRLEQLANHLEKWADRWSHNPNTKDYWQSMRREAEYLREIAARPATP